MLTMTICRFKNLIDDETDSLLVRWLAAANMTKKDLLSYKTFERLRVNVQYDGYLLVGESGKQSKIIGCGISGIAREKAKKLFMHVGLILDKANENKTRLMRDVVESFERSEGYENFKVHR